MGDAKRLHDRARAVAVRDLIDLHPGEYRLLYDASLDELRRAEGWTDGRPAANRDRAKEGHR